MTFLRFLFPHSLIGVMKYHQKFHTYLVGSLSTYHDLSNLSAWHFLTHYPGVICKIACTWRFATFLGLAAQMQTVVILPRRTQSRHQQIFPASLFVWRNSTYPYIITWSERLVHRPLSSS